MRQTNRSKILLLSAVASLAVTSAQAALKISNEATRNVTCASGVCTATAKDAVLNVGDLADLLASASVQVKSGGKAGDIDLDANLSWSSASSLTLDAFHSIVFTKPLTVEGPGDLTLTYNHNRKHDPKTGELAFAGGAHARFPSTNNSLTINGVSFTLASNITALASGIASNPSGSYALINDYDATADGTYSHSPIPTAFNGTFEGLGNAIDHLTINDPTGSEVALFSEVDSPGTLRDIGVLHVNVSGYAAAALTFENDGTVFRASATGTVSSPLDAGGDVGGLVVQNNFGSVIQSHAAVRVTGGYVAGGLVERNFGSTALIAQSFATGSVFGTEGAGGLIGGNEGVIENSYSIGNVKMAKSGGDGVGGVCQFGRFWCSRGY